MLLALLRLKQVNLTQLALAFASQSNPKSRSTGDCNAFFGKKCLIMMRLRISGQKSVA